MKNKDLIQKLLTFNPEADVSLTTSEDITLSYISEGGEADESNIPQIFIEPCDFCQTCFYYDDSYCGFYDLECSEVEECYQYEEVFNEP